MVPSPEAFSLNSACDLQLFFDFFLFNLILDEIHILQCNGCLIRNDLQKLQVVNIVIPSGFHASKGHKSGKFIVGDKWNDQLRIPLVKKTQYILSEGCKF